jgi:hypothetical protein
LGSPTVEEIKDMNPNYDDYKFPVLKQKSWDNVNILYIYVYRYLVKM